MTKINSVELLHVVGLVKQMPVPELPEIAFVGRSNVGKSSLINSLLNRKSMARISGRPGKTQTLNFYLVNQELFLVDLPGYGYAKVPYSVRQRWKTLLEGYLLNRPTLRAIVMLVDCRHNPSDSDRQMFSWLSHYGRPIIIAATKVDKLKQREYADKLKALKAAYGQVPLIPYSSVKGRGRDELWRLLLDLATFEEVEIDG